VEASGSVHPPAEALNGFKLKAHAFRTRGSLSNYA
jgi:hypothetical protein